MTPEPTDLDRWADAVDACAHRLAAEWYRHPLFAPLDDFQGVSLGELAEYSVISVVLAGIQKVAPRV